MPFVFFKTENIANHYNLLCYFYLYVVALDYSAVTKGVDIISRFDDNTVSRF